MTDRKPDSEKPAPVEVDAKIIADAFSLDAATVQNLMRAGEITSLCERGEGEDTGRMRLTFWYGDRALRLIMTDAGALISQTRFPVPGRTKAKQQTATRP
ncbi:DUF6522 family protein [Amaricoccus tamworthensis]|uniref:DUF6522 family protein n=1 Tax=Amaricoccus tamworthensis TaxID=57002 RepID=UPI003C7C8F0D